jgi:hypothetical protein
MADVVRLLRSAPFESGQFNALIPRRLLRYGYLPSRELDGGEEVH